MELLTLDTVGAPVLWIMLFGAYVFMTWIIATANRKENDDV